jgi:hypothetical protein
MPILYMPGHYAADPSGRRIRWRRSGLTSPTPSAGHQIGIELLLHHVTHLQIETSWVIRLVSRKFRVELRTTL